MRISSITLLCVLLFVPGMWRLRSQPIALSGAVNIASEVYSPRGVAGNRTRSAHRAILRQTISLFDQVVLPFEFYHTTEDRGFRQPFNQFGVSPTLFGWLTIHGGYFSTQLSELTFGDARVYGGGVQARPLSCLRISAIYGRTQEAVRPDTLKNFSGTYKRRLFAAKVGIGSEEAFHVDLHFMRSVDDQSSIPVRTESVAPMENSVGSVLIGVPLFDNRLRMKSEVALAGFSGDIRSGKTSSYGIPPWIFTPRTSSNLDGAVILSLQSDISEGLSLGVNARWIGPGYVTLGYSQLPNDVFDIVVSPTLRLVNRQLTLRASVGSRKNNLRRNRLAKTQRTLAHLNLSYQLTESLGLDIQYSNNGMRSRHLNDTLRVDNIQQSFTLAPRVGFSSFGGMSSVTPMFSVQGFTDRNVVTSASNRNKTINGSCNWTISFPSSLTAASVYTYSYSRTGGARTKVHSISETLGYSVLDNALNLSLTGSYNIIKTVLSDGNLNASASATYRTNSWGAVTLMFSTRQYRYASPALGDSYSEMHGSLQYNFSY